jgi:outer membrane protein TolC
MTIMKRRTYIVAVTFIFVLLSASFGEEGTTPLAIGEQGAALLTLQESIEVALQKSPTLQAAQGVIKEAKYRRLGAVSDFLPQVGTQYSYTRLDENPTMSIPIPPTPTTVTIGSKDI